MNKQSKQMANDDVLVSLILIGIGISIFPNHPIFDTILTVFGTLVLGLRIYHLFFLKD